MGGGMEHQTMTTIHNFNFYLVAHELAHQWFGDYITCGNWQDIWINEGFASYLEYIAAQELLGQGSADGWMANAMSIALGETEGSVYVPEDQVEETFRLFDYGLTYKKGAILLHMIRYHLNDDEVFFNVLQEYLRQYGNGLAKGEDFREILESVSGEDFSCFFEQWYYGEGYPEFTVQWYQEQDTLKITSEQSTKVPEVTPFFNTPFDLLIKYNDGSEQLVRLTQDQPVNIFKIVTEGSVEDIVFDPNQWLLKQSTVIQQVQTGRKFVYWPNPVADQLFVQLMQNAAIDEVFVTNMNGQEVLRYNSSNNPVVLNLGVLPDGPYLLVLREKEKTYLEKIVKVSKE
jgi:aminopeptidase N